jgi:hypothetical protein
MAKNWRGCSLLNLEVDQLEKLWHALPDPSFKLELPEKTTINRPKSDHNKQKISNLNYLKSLECKILSKNWFLKLSFLNKINVV